MKKSLVAGAFAFQIIG
jgi:hypothetical protein